MSINKRELIKTIGQDGKSLELAIIRPGHKLMQDANMIYNLKVSQLIRKAVDGGERLLLRSEVEDYLIKTKIWTNDDVSKIEQFGLRIRAIEFMLQKGGIKLSDARKLAIEMSSLRAQIMVLYNKKQQLDNSTIEAFSENQKFSFLMVKCTMFADTGKPFLNDEDDYLERGDEIAVIDAAKCLSKILYGIKEDISMNFYENKWLKDHNFIDKRGRLLNTDGGFIDKEGNKVDEDGRFIDSNNCLIDKNGIKVNENGDFIIENPKPFLNDDGNPIQNNKSKKSTTKRKRRKK
jgi:hypothetical protein